MKKFIQTTVFTLTALAALPAMAAELVYSDGYASATTPGTKVSAAYFKVSNASAADVTLVGASSTIAKQTELHKSVIENDKMVMRHQDKIVVKAGETVNFHHKGYHVMFMQLTQKLKAGSEITLQISYADGTKQELVLPVKQTAVTTKHAHHHHADKATETMDHAGHKAADHADHAAETAVDGAAAKTGEAAKAVEKTAKHADHAAKQAGRAAEKAVNHTGHDMQNMSKEAAEQIK